MTAERNRNRDRIVGSLVWSTIVAMSAIAIARGVNLIDRAVLSENAIHYWLGRGLTIVRNASPQCVDRDWIVLGEPVFCQLPDIGWRQVGYVESTASGVRIRWYEPSIDPARCRMVAHRNRGTISEMTSLMFPAEKREAVAERVSLAMRQHGNTLAERFGPLVERSLRESLPAIEAELFASLERHAAWTGQVGSRLRDEMLRGKLVPLAKDQLLPIARFHAEPTIREIGQELWDRASLWRFTWRAVYDKTPLPRRDLMREEWERFVNEEAIPVVEAHADAIAIAIQNTLAEIARNQEVRGELAAVVSQLADDPELRELVRVVLRESLVENKPLRRVWQYIWTSDEASSALEETGILLDPLMHEIGEELFGSPRRGIDPGFARVLRHQVLGKDRHWIIAEPIKNGQGQGEESSWIFPSEEVSFYPVLYFAHQPQRHSSQSLGEAR